MADFLGLAAGSKAVCAKLQIGNGGKKFRKPLATPTSWVTLNLPNENGHSVFLSKTAWAGPGENPCVSPDPPIFIAAARNPLAFAAVCPIIPPMASPNEPVNLTAEQVRELHGKLAILRHDVNNELSKIAAGLEVVHRRPEAADRIWPALIEQPRKVSDLIAQFSAELETALNLKRS
jgi:hypothetical protein